MLKAQVLKAQVYELKDLKLSGQLIHKLKDGDNKKKKGDNDGKNTTKKLNKRDRSIRWSQEDEEGMKTLPKDKEPKQKQLNKKTRHWCIHRVKWTVHTPKD